MTRRSRDKFYFSTPVAMKEAANAAAYEIGLTSAAEYMRIALEFLVEHKTMPAEFKGKRSIMKIGRPFAREEAAQ